MFDGSPIKDLAGYKVYRSSHEVDEPCDDCENAPEFHAEIDLANLMNAELKDNEVIYKDYRITLGNIYYYWVASYNTKSVEGPKSQVIKVIYDNIPPVPGGITSHVRFPGRCLEMGRPRQTGRYTLVQNL